MHFDLITEMAVDRLLRFLLERREFYPRHKSTRR